MGSTHLGVYSELPGVEVAAVCSQTAESLTGNLANVGGNLNRPARNYDFSNMRRYRDWRLLIEDPSLDAIDICLPTYLHAEIAVASLRAGKHVLCEKPMALSSHACAEMLRTAESGSRVLMIAHVLRFWPEYNFLEQFVKNGSYGRVLSATFYRRCGVPDWSAWLPDESQSGGAVLDLLSHDIDQALRLFGTPARLAAKSMGGLDTLMASLIYPGGPEVRIQGGWFAPATPFSMSFHVRAERAELEWRSNGLFLSDVTGKQTQIELPAEDAYRSEIAYFLECCLQGKQPDRCPPLDSARAVIVAELLRESRNGNGAQLLYRAPQLLA